MTLSSFTSQNDTHTHTHTRTHTRTHTHARTHAHTLRGADQGDQPVRKRQRGRVCVCVCVCVLRGTNQGDQPVRVHVPQRPLRTAVVVPRRLPRCQPLPGHGSGRSGAAFCAHDLYLIQMFKSIWLDIPLPGHGSGRPGADPPARANYCFLSLFPLRLPLPL